MEDSWLELLKSGKCLPEPDLFTLCEKVKSLLILENNAQPVSAPVIICGDIHGQLWDLFELFRISGAIPEKSYIFMGDYVDRGYNSVETFQYLIALKARYPSHITILRGNHESRQITQIYGFYDECMRKYGNPNPWKFCVEVFDLLNITAIVDNRIMCVHGGLSPEIKTIDQIRVIDRKVEIPHEGAFCDMMWSDPDDIETWSLCPRGAGWLFGSRVTDEFNYINGLALICRAHQLVQSGYKFWFPSENLVTVWSAPNYCYRCGNQAAVMCLDEALNREFKVFEAVAESSKSLPPRAIVPYFL
jgi:serine/threonine-protein phosphatase 6 catalytic subunit